MCIVMGGKAECDMKTEMKVDVSKTSQYHCNLHEIHFHVFSDDCHLIVISMLNSWACCLWVYYANI